MRYEEKPIPVLFGHKENCCGCSACYAVCPVQAISMVPDAEGFAYPVIDGSKCIRCGRCAAVCTFRRDQARKGMCSGGASVQSEPACPGQFDAPLCHAVKHKCLDIRMASRSGGVFTALSDPVLARGGVVYGCVLTDSFDAVHIRAAEPADRDRMRGSKYIQSNLLDTFLEVRADLEAGRDVLFSGTSCQVAGLRSFLKKDYAKLLCVDIVCHGVPSPRVWHAFLDWQRSRNHAEIVSVDFRNKLHFGWSSHVESVYLQNGKRADSEVFKNLFFGHHVLRESCYKCPYKSTQHPGDLTIADYWGIDQAAPGFNDNKGVSLVLLNNPRGTEAFRNILPELDHRATRLEDSLQPMLVGSFERPRERERFWADFETLAFDRIARKYAKFGAINSVKAALRELKHKAGRLVRKCFPGARK